MADNNRNQDRQSYNQDWEKHRHRFNEENDFNQNRENYGGQNAGNRQNAGSSYGESSGGYGGNSYGSQGQYGRQRYENLGRSYGQGSSGGNDESSYGSGYGNRNDWDNNQWQGSSGMQGGNYGREDSRRNSGSGYGQNSGSGGYSGSNYGDTNRYGSGQGNYGGSNYGRRDYDRNRDRNIYGGDERNYGNANQGGFDRDWWQRTKDEVSAWFGDEDAERRRRMDHQTNAGHRGKGPKDYKRSEDRIREDICDRLSDDDRLDATHVNVQVQGTEVVLTGNVNSREEKRRAEDLVESISGVRHVENRLRVERVNDDDNDRSKWPRADADDESRKGLK